MLDTYLHDLDFALITYGLTARDVPLDHEGLSIVDRLQRLVEHGESYPHSPFRSFHAPDIRSGKVSLWELFPENPATRAAQDELLDVIGELTHEGNRLTEGLSADPASELHQWEGVLRHLDAADTELPDDLPDDLRLLILGLREAEGRVRLRAELVEELALGLPPATEHIVRWALDSEANGLRSADITAAGLRIQAMQWRERITGSLDRLRPAVENAERLREAYDQLEATEAAMHWPGEYTTMPQPQMAAHRRHAVMSPRT